jgi:hypothetical protein
MALEASEVEQKVLVVLDMKPLYIIVLNYNDGSLD